MNEHLTGIPTSLSGLKFKLWITYETNGSQPEIFVKSGKLDLFSLSVEEPIRILKDCGYSISDESLKEIKEFIKINRDILLHFYYHSIKNDFDDYMDFYSNLKKVS